MNEYLEQLENMLKKYRIKFDKKEIREFIEIMALEIDIRNELPKELKQKIMDLKIYDCSEQYYIDTYLVEDKKSVEKLNSEGKYELGIISLFLDDDEMLKRFEITYEKLSNNNFEEEIVKFYKELLCLVIADIADDNKRIKMLDSYAKDFNEEEIDIIILGIKNDDKKIEKLEEYKSKIDKEKFDVSYVILSIDDDDKKIMLFEKYKEEILDEELISDIIISIEDDDKKIMLLDKYKEEMFGEEELILDVITSIKDDDKKIKKIDEFEKALNSIDEDDVEALTEYMFFPLMSIEDDDKKIEKINEYKDKLKINDIAELIASIKDDDKKINMSKKLKINSSKMFGEKIIPSIKDNKKKNNHRVLSVSSIIVSAFIGLGIILIISYILLSIFF